MVFRVNIGDLTNLHNEKNSIWKLRVNGIISVTITRVNVYQFVNVAALLPEQNRAGWVIGNRLFLA